MLRPAFTTRFRRDLKRMRRRGKDPEKFKKVARRLVAENPLPQRYRDHKLAGPFKKRGQVYVGR